MGQNVGSLRGPGGPSVITLGLFGSPAILSPISEQSNKNFLRSNPKYENIIMSYWYLAGIMHHFVANILNTCIMSYVYDQI